MPTHSSSASGVLSSLDDHDDIVSWINDVLDSSQHGGTQDEEASSSLADLDQRVSHLVGTLELASEDTSSQVENLIDDISRNASRLTYDLHFMREGALSLQSLLRTVETKSQASTLARTSAALDQLHHLDTVKRNMHAAREVLREAESWGTLESDVTSLLGEQNYEKAAERLSEANKSMVVFTNTPEYEARRALMVSLQNQLEASLSSALVAAVNSQDVAVCKNYFSIFRNIQRESEFRNYYYGSRRAPLTDVWHLAHLTDCESPEGTPNTTFSQFFATFLSSFLAMLQAERVSIPAIFPDPQFTLSTLITSTLSALQPTFSQRLSSLSSNYGSSTLPHVIAIYKQVEEFAASANKIFEKVGYAAMLAPHVEQNLAANVSRAHSRRRSTRMSISGRAGIAIQNTVPSPGSLMPLDWDQDLFEPFLDLQVDYGLQERRLILDVLKEIMGGELRPNLDRSRLLRERSVDVFSLAEGAMNRCIAFTHGYGSVGLVKSLNELMSEFLEQSKTEIASRHSGAGDPSSTSVADLSDLDYTSEDWSDIQSLLHLLESARALRDRLGSLEGKLRHTLAQASTVVRANPADPGFSASSVTRGAVQLLAQSSLNTVDLQSLLDQVDSEASRPTHPPRTGGETLSATSTTTDFRRHSSLSLNPQPPGPFLSQARESLSSFTKACQVALQNTMLRPLYQRLSSYATSPLWSAQGDGKNKRGPVANALSDVHLPSFSLSPSETMQRVAEGLLNLPRLFESYADDGALSFSLDTLPFLDPRLLRGLAEPSPLPSPSVNPHTRRSPSISLKAPPPVAPNFPELTPEAVSSAWLSSLSLSLLSHLTTHVLTSIRALTASGAAQLASDLGYLGSIVTALNVEYEELERWKEYVEMDDSTGKGKVQELKEDVIFATVAKLRGWSTLA